MHNETTAPITTYSFRSIRRNLAVFVCGFLLHASAYAGEFSVDPAAFSPNQTFAQDSLSPDWFNSSGTVVEHNNWTAAPANYFASDNADLYVLKTKASSRDQEVESWSRTGNFYLRLTDSGKCIAFAVNGDVPNGFFGVYLLTGKPETNANAARTFPIFQTSDMASMVTNYHGSNTDTDHFTFGVSGFDIYAKWNGQEFFRVREYRHMESGRIAIQGRTAPYGVRKTTARLFDPKPLFSNYSNQELDLRDFGWRTSACVGSIDAGTNLLRLQAPPNPPIQKGDYLIAELGGEAGRGLRGTRGVGGVWPELSYPSAALRDADQSQPMNTYAWAEADGTVRQWNGAQWLDISTSVNYEPTPPVTNSTYYPAKAIPMALRAYVETVSPDGLTLTLSRLARANSTNANVYFDNAFVFDRLGRSAQYDGADNYPFERPSSNDSTDFRDITPTNLTLRIPAGDYAVGERLLIDGHAGWKIMGAGADLTRIFSPRGVPCASLMFQFSPDAEVRDLHIQGNARNDGFGVKWPTLFLQWGNVTQTSFPGDSLPPGLEITQGSERSRIVNVRATDVFPKAIGASFTHDVWADNCQVVLTEGQRAYIQWPYSWSDCTGGGATNCTLWSPELIHGWSIFRSTGVQYLNCISTNGIMAPNGSGNFRVKDFMFIITPGSQPPDLAFGVESIVNVNNNIKDPTFLSQGGLLENVRIFQLGYINASNDTLFGIDIQAENPNVTVRGGVFSSPDYAQPSKLYGPVGVNSTGLNTVVDGFRVAGKARGQTGFPDGGNIGLYDGVVRNCFADSINVNGPARIENCLPNSNRAPIIGRFRENLILQGRDIGIPGDPLETGTTTVLSDDEIEVRAGGSFFITGFADFLHFSYLLLRGDFDLVVQVTRLDAVSRNRTAAGIMVRHGLDNASPGLRLVQLSAYDKNGLVGGNHFELTQRVAPGGYVGVPQVSSYTGLTATNVFANVWMRLVRHGDTFIAYRGSHGGFLEPFGTLVFPTPVPEELLLGLTTASGDNSPGASTTAHYRNLQIVDRSPITNRTVLQGTVVNLTIPVIEHDQGQSVTFALAGNPLSATIHPATGAFTWDTAGVPAPSTNEFVVVATDNGTPPLSDTNRFRILLTQPNVAPVITPPQPVTVPENGAVQVLVVAQDNNLPPQSLSFALGGVAPLGVGIDPSSGQFSWTPSEEQGPGTYPITVRVTDDGTPPLSAEQTFTVTVREVNSPPQLSVISDQSIEVGRELTFAATATDADLPPNVLTFSLGESAPPGAAMTAAGVFNWTPTEAQASATHPVTVVVADDGSPPRSDRKTFQVTVTRTPAQAPTLAARVEVGAIVISFPTQAGRVYQLQTRTDLSQDQWRDEGDSLIGNGEPGSFRVPVASSSLYLRVQVRPNP